MNGPAQVFDEEDGYERPCNSKRMDTSRTHEGTNMLAEPTANTVLVTIVREDTEVPQSPILDLAVDEEAINKVVREAREVFPSTKTRWSSHLHELPIQDQRFLLGLRGSHPPQRTHRWMTLKGSTLSRCIRGHHRRPNCSTLPIRGGTVFKANTNSCASQHLLGRSFRENKALPRNT